MVNAKPLRRAGPKGFRRVIVIEQRSQDLSYITRGERGWDPRGEPCHAIFFGVRDA
jgi:hypothetical protein